MRGLVSPSRRRFLGGAGTLVALPFLDSLQPSRARGATVAAPRRLLFFYVPCGIHMAAWTPATAGPDFAFTPILKSLEPLRSRVLVVSGLANMPAKPDGAGDHASGTGGFLTCSHPKKTEGIDIENGISVDQVAAAQLGRNTRFPSLQLGIDGGSSAGGCDSGYSCAYARNISWAGPQTPLPKQTNPQTIFDRLFQGTDAGLSLAEAAQRRAHKTSVLDYASDEAQRLASRLGGTDRHKLDEYLSGVRDVETRLQLGGQDGGVCKFDPRPTTNLSYPDQMKMTNDLMVLAMQCDLTRVISFMIGNAASGRTYPFIGVTGAHHQLSHHQMRPDYLTALQAIGTWELEQLAYLVTKMNGVTEANGSTLLDNSLVFLSSEITDGDAHNHDNMPVVVVGKGGGAFKSGTHIQYPVTQKMPLANLYLSMLSAVGVTASGFGNSTAPLNGL